MNLSLRPASPFHAMTWGAVVLAGALSLTASAEERPQQLPTIRLNAGIHNIVAEVAQTPQQRAIGLMHRSALPANAGMLFVFEEPATQCYWMKDTLIPLSIAFLADDGRVVNVAEMQPLNLESVCSAGPVRFALEMGQGWFAKRGLGAGGKLTGAAFKSTP